MNVYQDTLPRSRAESECVKKEDVYQTLHHPPTVKNPNPTHGSPQSIRLIMILLIFNTLLLIIILILTGTFKSQNRTLTEVVKLSSSVESLSSKLQSTDQRVMAALCEMKTKLDSSSKTAGGSTCKPGWTLYGCKCYFFSDDKLNWHQARDYCRSQNALLLKLEAKDERAFVTARTTSNFYWVGLTDENTGQWRWDDGTPYVMNKDEWVVGQPDNWKDLSLGEEGEDCGHIKTAGRFNDAHCSIKMHYICKA
ncbi:asialoglycoprotein receptor 2-like [Colossoma macropomum]|uniref:asialoglycoprotein receptor 2-like n=1 Tax=Colossoma macropomum TaxID=42526 RepID=UPI001864227E|nr:asialoglycoprotein receptor 2-like [Colossoma macropomum]